MTSNIFRMRRHGVQYQNYNHFMTTDPNKYRVNITIDLNARKIINKYFRSYYICNVYTKIIDQKSRLLFSCTVVILNLIPVNVIRLVETLINRLDPKLHLEFKVEKYYNQPITAGIVSAKMCAQLSEPGSIQRKLNYVMKFALRKGAIGCIIRVQGRLGGAEIAHHESIREGKIRRNTIDYDVTTYNNICLTKSGVIGVRVSLYRGSYNKTSKI